MPALRLGRASGGASVLASRAGPFSTGRATPLRNAAQRHNPRSEPWGGSTGTQSPRRGRRNLEALRPSVGPFGDSISRGHRIPRARGLALGFTPSSPSGTCFGPLYSQDSLRELPLVLALGFTPSSPSGTCCGPLYFQNLLRELPLVLALGSAPASASRIAAPRKECLFKWVIKTFIEITWPSLFVHRAKPSSPRQIPLGNIVSVRLVNPPAL